MRVGFISYNAQGRNAIGNHLVDKVAFFRERGAQTRVFVQSLDRLHPALQSITRVAARAESDGAAWQFLAEADLVIVEYSQYYDLLHFLPLLVGGKPKLLVDYHGVTPPSAWRGPNEENLARGLGQRGLVWCADAVICHSRFTAEELMGATGFPPDGIQRLSFPMDRGALDNPSPREEEHAQRLAAPLARETSRSDWRNRLGIGSAPLLLFVGRLAANKRAPLLVEALAQLKDLPLAVHALFLGDDTDLYAAEADRCRDLAKMLQVSEQIHFAGQVDDRGLRDAYHDADVLVMPSIHEGFCIPVLEAQAHGLPVIAARASALPETIGNAGLTFNPDDVADLARQLRRLLSPAPLLPGEQIKSRRLAIACFRFGPGIVGGAEASLKTIAQALQRAGDQVEIFTTCTSHESRWTNDLPEGTTIWEGLTIHRFPIDPHDRDKHLVSNRRLLEAQGRITSEAEADFVRHSIHSTKLMESLWAARNDLDAVIIGPYLFGLTADIAQEFGAKTLLLPCFHDEPHARLRIWTRIYGEVGGVLYHSPEEQDYGQRVLGLNHPNAEEIGTWLPPTSDANQPVQEAPYLVYCGRWSQEKNMPLLLEYLAKYHEERGPRFQVIVLGGGDLPIPEVGWLQKRGRVEEAEKARLLAGAAALVQLSTRESLSLVVLEAWAAGTPVIVHRDCAVLHGLIERSQGGQAIQDYQSFARALDELAVSPALWRAMGKRGQDFVRRHYQDESVYVQRLRSAVDNLKVPLGTLMRQRGLERARQASRPHWNERFGQLIDHLVHQTPRQIIESVVVEPIQPVQVASNQLRTLLVPVRLTNAGNVPALSDGPARTQLFADWVEDASGLESEGPEATSLPGLLMPGKSAPAALVLTAPSRPGIYRVRLWAGRPGFDAMPLPSVMTLQVEARPMGEGQSLLETVHAALADAQRLQNLPDDYVDVTQGRFARLKRWLKRKFLGNFKSAYVDVLSRQQSQVNRHMLTAVQQLTQTCATLDHAVRGLLEKLATPDRKTNENHTTENTTVDQMIIHEK